ncbi:MAG: hypothetical protein AAF928_16570 [Myxococcota bacterium]
MKTPYPIVLGIGLVLTACGGEKPRTETPEPDTSQEFEEAAEAVGDEIEGAAEDVSEGVSDAAEEVSEETDPDEND